MQSRELLRFHLTGERPTGADEDSRLLLPALLAPYRHVANLRHDYPLVLVDGTEHLTRTLSGLFDDVIGRMVSPGPAGERRRRHLLALEKQMRSRVQAGAPMALSQLWKSAASELLAASRGEDRELLRESLEKARASLDADGPVIACDGEAAVRIFEHAWRKISGWQADVMRREIAELTQRLSNILKADDAHSPVGLRPSQISASIGTSHRSEFDFDSWSCLVATQPAHPLDGERRRRIETVISILGSQRFFPTGKTSPYSFFFERISFATAAFRRRLPQMLEVIKALRIARLESENRYRRDRHDSYFDAFDSTWPTAADISRFPSYLVATSAAALSVADQVELTELLTSPIPMRVLVYTDEIDGGLPRGEDGQDRSPARLAAAALGLGEAFVLQATTSALPSMQPALKAGLSYPGPSLFSVFGAADETPPGLSPYLASAAAVQARAFPVFVFDPSAGSDWADRLRIDLNPQPENDWPIEALDYEDDRMQRVTEEAPFTFVDFAACDPRNADHFLRVPRSSWSDDMEPAWRFLNGEARTDKVPYVLVASENNTLERLLVRRELIEAARRCRVRWHSLQELGGIHNSHARRLLEAERARWEIEKAEEMRELTAGAVATAAAEPGSTVATLETPEPAVETPGGSPEELTEVVEIPSPDEPSIETARCTTCDECTAINPRMFAYDDNKQAYIADVTAGTYRQLVEAAEVCPVAIIHPGKPRDPGEPGLDELMARAAPFNEAVA